MFTAKHPRVSKILPLLGMLMLCMACQRATATDNGPPEYSVATLAIPVVTSRNFVNTVGPHARGGYNWIGQFMNYKSTDRPKVTHQLPSGEHYITYADTEDRPDAEWVVLDLETGDYRIFDMPGFHSPSPPALAGNGRVFFAVDYAHIYYYDPVDETIKILGRVHDDLNVLRGFYRFEPGPDGMIYGAAQATNGQTVVMRLNPDTLDYTLVEQVGVPGRRGLTYGYYIAVDPPWVYTAVGQGQWELWAVNMDSGEKKMLAERIEGEGARIITARNEHGQITASLRGEPGVQQLLLRDGEIVTRGEVGTRFEPSAPAETFTPIVWQASTPVTIGPAPQIAESRRVSIEADGSARLGWRPAEDEGPWREATFQIQRAEPELIESLSRLPDGSILGNARQYHGWFHYDPTTQVCTYLGRGGPSGPRTTLLDGKLYFAGYPNTTLYVYDPDRPWHNALSNDGDANPRQIASQGQGRSEAHHAVAMASAGERVYTMGKRSRWSTGTGLVAYRPADNSFIALGEANKDLDPVAMIAMPALERIIVSGARPDAQLLLYDLQLDDAGTITLAEGLTNTGHLLAVDDTHFLGWYAVDDDTTAIYLYDLQNDKLVKRVTLAGPVGPIFHRPVDNSFWILQGTQLGRLDPRTLSVTAVAQLDRRPGLPLWIDHTLYGRSGGELVRVSVPLP